MLYHESVVTPKSDWVCVLNVDLRLVFKITYISCCLLLITLDLITSRSTASKLNRLRRRVLEVNLIVCDFTRHSSTYNVRVYYRSRRLLIYIVLKTLCHCYRLILICKVRQAPSYLATSLTKSIRTQTWKQHTAPRCIILCTADNYVTLNNVM